MVNVCQARRDFRQRVARCTGSAASVIERRPRELDRPEASPSGADPPPGRAHQWRAQGVGAVTLGQVAPLKRLAMRLLPSL